VGEAVADAQESGSGEGDVRQDEEQQDDEGVIEEAAVSKPAKDPHAPSLAEREEHEATHLPYRSWCAECVCGRRDNPPHLRRSPEERTVPMVLMDYAFVRRHDEVEKITVLLMKDRESRAVRAWVMRNKGVCYEEAAVRATEGIKSFGHTDKILLKVDNEAALLALRDEVIRLLGQQAVPVAPPANESESSGAVENGVKIFKGLLRVHLMALERKLDGYIPSAHPLMTWLVEHVSDLLTKCLQGSDGKIGYGRLFGKKVHEEGLEFGEKIMFRLKAPRRPTSFWIPGGRLDFGLAGRGDPSRFGLRLARTKLSNVGRYIEFPSQRDGSGKDLNTFEPRHGSGRSQRTRQKETLW
jgi:hypothetical protein